MDITSIRQAHKKIIHAFIIVIWCEAADFWHSLFRQTTSSVKKYIAGTSQLLVLFLE